MNNILYALSPQQILLGIQGGIPKTKHTHDHFFFNDKLLTFATFKYTYLRLYFKLFRLIKNLSIARIKLLFLNENHIFLFKFVKHDLFFFWKYLSRYLLNSNSNEKFFTNSIFILFRMIIPKNIFTNYKKLIN